ncbi:protease inhibitor I42 family protein [Prosthecobacter sp.]|uniref:protease inhibitor I42 family protein n=1 Tax=Prosthecobacter sp. TaxID=1965333 RepID=UPI001DAB7CF2|nr:protease inhibitor I42 family protein [Prosthecobacter sp.]MCB1278224.1 protease inhibitor I42 family protein [Prosthecobacter sp.]
MSKPFVILLLVMNLAACGPDPKPSVKEETPEAPKTEAEAKKEDGDSIRKKTGETFTVDLESNPTTGYGWALDGKEDATVVRKVSDEFVGTPHPPGVVGVGGTEQWKFQAEKKGKTTLHFIYRRPWEKGIDPIRERTINVSVE